MDISISFPATLPENDRLFLLNWARQADAGPFLSLGIIDRVVYQNVDALTTLAAAAAITSRINLMSTIIVAPLRSASLLAKQSATLDILSGGRLTLGLGVGIREDDFLATGRPFHGRGKQFEQQLSLMSRIWTGQTLNDQVGAIGPRPIQQGGPKILIGGTYPAAINRLKTWGTGYIAGTLPLNSINPLYRQAEKVWHEARRPGRPRLVACAYYALGLSTITPAVEEILRYYGSGIGPLIASTLASTVENVKASIRKFADIGTDELIFLPAFSDIDQLSRLVDAL